MQWKVMVSDKTIVLEERELLNTLLSAINKKLHPEQEALAKVAIEFVQEQKLLSDIRLDELASLIFQLGYFYRIFLEKNQVQIEIENNEPDLNYTES